MQTAKKKTALQKAAAELARKGGKARAANMTKAERSEAARKAVNARWKNYKRSRK